MTVCIAAICAVENDRSKIVLCRDWRGEIQGVGSSDNIEKIRKIAKGWVALYAGSDPRAEELLVRYENHIKKTPFTEENIVDEARAVFHEYKKTLIESHFNTKYGVPYTFIINHAMQKFGETFVRECVDEASKIFVGVELLLAGFVEVIDYTDMKPWMAPMIVLVSEITDGDVVSLESEFAAIGSAANTARTMLFLRNQDSQDSLMETIYAVFEAKTLSETVPGIGESYSIDVIDEDGRVMSITDEGAKRCKTLFARFGPRDRSKKTKQWFDIKDAYLESWEEEPSDSYTLPIPSTLEDQNTTTT
jgi:ATP-dependent protease HslVU (ClpYQ) peptidase subunit